MSSYYCFWRLRNIHAEPADALAFLPSCLKEAPEPREITEGGMVNTDFADLTVHSLAYDELALFYFSPACNT